MWVDLSEQSQGVQIPIAREGPTRERLPQRKPSTLLRMR